MTPPTPEELLRLARKLNLPGEPRAHWDDTSAYVGVSEPVPGLGNVVTQRTIAFTIGPSAPQALHAALLVLAGEGRICRCKEHDCHDDA